MAKVALIRNLDEGKTVIAINTDAVDYVVAANEGGCKVAMRNGHLNVFHDTSVEQMYDMLWPENANTPS